MPLKININVSDLAKDFKDFTTEVERDLKQGVANLAAITHAKVKEMASSELKTSRQEFMDSLSFEEISEGIWVVSVSEKALWIEDGLPQDFDMKPGLLKNAKTSREGHKYQIIPFEHSKAPSQLTTSAREIVTQLRTNLKRANIPFKKLERYSSGGAKIGKLHSLSFPSDIPGKGNTPALKGVSIYQSVTKSGNVRRDILTFRTVTDGPGSSGKWIHPGMEAKKFLDRASDWAMKEWEEKILPEIMDKWK